MFVWVNEILVVKVRRDFVRVVVVFVILFFFEYLCLVGVLDFFSGF